MATEKLLTLAEVADYLRVNVETVRRYVRSGKLRAVRLGGGRAGYRVPQEELERMRPWEPPPPSVREGKTIRFGGEWPTDPAEIEAKIRELRREIESIPGNKDLPAIAVQVIREMREENG